MTFAAELMQEAIKEEVKNEKSKSRNPWIFISLPETLVLPIIWIVSGIIYLYFFMAASNTLSTIESKEFKEIYNKYDMKRGLEKDLNPNASCEKRVDKIIMFIIDSFR